jgi:hypothetical protein
LTAQVPLSAENTTGVVDQGYNRELSCTYI